MPQLLRFFEHALWMSASLGFVLFSSSAAACIICPDWEESKLGIGGIQCTRFVLALFTPPIVKIPAYKLPLTIPDFLAR